jgi:hypothetical protein
MEGLRGAADLQRRLFLANLLLLRVLLLHCQSASLLLQWLLLTLLLQFDSARHPGTGTGASGAAAERHKATPGLSGT